MVADEVHGDERPAGPRPAPLAVTSDPVLVASGVRKSFGGVHAVDVDTFAVRRGAITALIGPNGAGKSTLFNVLTGFERADEGRWSFDGAVVSGLPAHRIAQRGMVRTFQLTKALGRMRVIDNMKLAAVSQRGERLVASLVPRLWREQERAIERRADDLLARFGLDRMRDELAATLSGGQRKLLEMARALMVEPRMVMLDEPMAGVNPALTQSLLGHVRQLREEGVTILFVEHDMDVVMGASDHVVVMAQGRVIAEGTPAEIRAHPAVVDAYLGRRHGRTHDTSTGGERG